ncbi:hypothetical protein AAC387_Pa05g3229 [Persea americana]
MGSVFLADPSVVLLGDWWYWLIHLYSSLVVQGKGDEDAGASRGVHGSLHEVNSYEVREVGDEASSNGPRLSNDVLEKGQAVDGK